MRLDIRTYGTVREAFGEKAFGHEAPSPATVGEIFSDLDAECPDISLLESFETGALLVLKNGTHVTQLDGLATTLADGDRLSLTSPPMPDG